MRKASGKTKLKTFYKISDHTPETAKAIKKKESLRNSRQRGAQGDMTAKYNVTVVLWMNPRTEKGY